MAPFHPEAMPLPRLGEQSLQAGRIPPCKIGEPEFTGWQHPAL
jgi:hypothetical protein